jgi:hypothetical protein
MTVHRNPDPWGHIRNHPVNNTGHGWVFVSESGKVWCYEFPILY